MSARLVTVESYSQAVGWIDNSRTGVVRLGHNTYMVRYGSAVLIYHHATPVVTISPDDSRTLDARGWWTLTTRQRLSQYSGGHVYFERGRTMYASGGSAPVEYMDGMRVDRYGRPMDYTYDREPVA